MWDGRSLSRMMVQTMHNRTQMMEFLHSNAKVRFAPFPVIRQGVCSTRKQPFAALDQRSPWGPSATRRHPRGVKANGRLCVHALVRQYCTCTKADAVSGGELLQKFRFNALFVLAFFPK